MIVSFLAKYNEWYPMNEKWISMFLVCTGMDTRDQTFNVDNNRLVITYALNKNPYKVGSFCDSEHFLNRTDPRLYALVQNATRLEAHVREKYLKFNPREIGPHLAFQLEGVHQNHFQYGREL